MSERVVDILERVQVDEQQRNVQIAVAATPGQHLLYPIQDQHPVRQPRERVVQRLMTNLFDQTRIADGHRRMSSQTVKSCDEIGLISQALRMIEHVGRDPADGLIRQPNDGRDPEGHVRRRREILIVGVRSTGVVPDDLARVVGREGADCTVERTIASASWS